MEIENLMYINSNILPQLYSTYKYQMLFIVKKNGLKNSKLISSRVGF